ncbi:MAG: CHRD domain-containing protein [Flavisolibacter sp.]
MNKLRIVSIVSAFCFALVFLSCSKGYHGKVYEGYAYFQSAQVVTANGIVLPPSTGGGAAQSSYDAGTHILNYTITWTGLSGPPIAIHIHGLGDIAELALPAPLGPYGIDSFKVSSTTYIKYAGGIAQKITVPSGSTNSGSISGSLFADNVVIKENDLLHGKYYFDIHTATNPLYITFGEVRAQISLSEK